MKKIWLAVAAVLLVAVIGGTVYVLNNLDSIVARIIEDEGSKVVGTKVAVFGVDISLREGRSTIAGLDIASPDGYAVGPAFSLGEISVEIDLESVRDEPIVIKEIRVLAPEVQVQILENASSNLLDLKKNTEEYAASHGAGSDADESGAPAAEQKRIRIERFVFEKGRIELDATALGLEKRSFDLPAIQLDDIGGADGARPDEIAQAVLGALIRQASAEVARSGVKDELRDRVTDELKDKTSGLLEKLGQ